MAALNYWSEADAVEFSTSVSTRRLRHDFTPPNANRPWIVFFAAETRNNNTTGSVGLRVEAGPTSTGVVTQWETTQQTRETNGNGDTKGDKRGESGFIVIDGQATPSTTRVDLYLTRTSAGFSYVTDVRMIAFELPVGTEVSALNTTRVTNNSSSVPTTIASISPPAGNYVVMAAAVFDQTNTSNMIRPNLTDGSASKFASEPYLRIKAVSDRVGFRVVWDKTGGAALTGSETLSLTFMSNANGVSAGANYPRLVAIPTSGFRNVYIHEDNTADTAATTTSYVDTASSYSPTIADAGDHLTVMSSTVEYNATSTTGFVNFLSNGSELGEQFWESESSTADRCMKFFGTADLETLSAGSRTYKFQRKASSGTSALQIEKYSIVIFDLDDGAGSGGATGTASADLGAIAASGAGEAGDGADHLNPADNSSEITFSNLWLTATKTSGGTGFRTVRGLRYRDQGQFYFEATGPVTSSSNVFAGLTNASASLTTFIGANANGVGHYSADGSIRRNGVVGNAGTWFSGAARTYVAVNLTTRRIWFKSAGATDWNGTPGDDPATGVGGIDISTVTGALSPSVTVFNPAVPDFVTLNLGASAFDGTPPSGFLAWSSPIEWAVGSASATLGLSGSAAGARGASGAATSSFALLTSANATHTPFIGAGSAALALVGAGTGARGAAGSGAALLPNISAAGSGLHWISGTASATLEITGAGTGDHADIPDTVTGGAAAALTLLASAAGTAYLNITGAGDATFSLQGAGSAVHGLSGAGAATLPALSGTAAGTHSIAGSAAATLTISGQGVGAALVAITGAGSATLAITGAAVGGFYVAISGQGEATFSLTQVAVGLFNNGWSLSGHTEGFWSAPETPAGAWSPVEHTDPGSWGDV